MLQSSNAAFPSSVKNRTSNDGCRINEGLVGNGPAALTGNMGVFETDEDGRKFGEPICA
jgi:hypothetical protein